MNILVQLVHPAHFHYYRNAIDTWKRQGHSVIVVITDKDILAELLKKTNIPYIDILPKFRYRSNKLGQLIEMAIRDWRMLRVVLKYKIDVLTGSSVEITHIGWLLRKSAINIGEDDAYIVPKYTNAIAPFLDVRVTPMACDNGPLSSRCIQYPGYLKLTYLHPNEFSSDIKVLKKYHIDERKPYFVLRFSALNAHHDKGIKGISYTIAKQIIEILYSYGKIYITSERPLEPEFEQYRLHINPLDIHHVMAYATIYIGDSQSMANEAAMLGTPSLRFNDFVGAKKIGVMEELEHVYGLTYGISSHEPEKLYAKIEELLEMAKSGNLRDEFQRRRQKMLADKIDVTAFLTWFIENYPRSKELAKNPTPEFWQQFK